VTEAIMSVKVPGQDDVNIISLGVMKQDVSGGDNSTHRIKCVWEENVVLPVC
jgi:hypothetical protein